MKDYRALLILFIFLQSSLAQATDYYLSAEGDDTQAGTSPQQAWQTLEKVQSIADRLQAGDQILFRRGDVFHGQLVLSRVEGTAEAPVVMGAYGNGPAPVLDGSVRISGWAKQQGNIWKASCSSCPSSLSALYMDGAFLSKARYPNADASNGGYLTEDKGHDFNDNAVVVDNDLPRLSKDDAWQGAELVARTREWLLDIAPVSRHQGNTIYLDKKLTYGIPQGFGYFFQNSYQALDQEGEWYYDAASKALYIYLSRKNPNEQVVEIPLQPEVIHLKNCRYLHIEQLQFQKGHNSTVRMEAVADSRFSGNSLFLSARNALLVENSSSLTIEDNTIEQTQNNALELKANQCLIQRNTISHTALVAGMGATGNGQYIACFMAGKDNTFSYNRILQTGYNAIHFDQGPWTITHNLIDGFNKTKNDGGAIYCFRNNIPATVSHNIILNGGGAEAGVPASEYAKDRGLYADNSSSHITYEGNTIAFCGEGMLVNASNDLTITGNTFAGNRTYSFRATAMQQGKAENDIRNLQVRNNVFVNANDYYPVFALETRKNDRELFGTFDQNILSQPLSSSEPATPYLFYTREDIGFPGKGNLDYQYYHYTDLKNWVYGKNDKLAGIYLSRYELLKKTSKNLVHNSGAEQSISSRDNWVSNYKGLSLKSTQESGMSGAAFSFRLSELQEEAASVVQKNIAVDAGKFYVLSFDVKAEQEATLVFRFLTACCGTVHSVRPFEVKTSPTRYQFIFQAAETTKEGRIFFDVKKPGNTIFLDNIELYEATVKETAFDQIVRLEYNASDKPKTVSLQQKYMTLEGKAAEGSIRLQPFTSVVLLPVSDQPGN